ncbi:acyl-CoA thioesterase [Bailinhaonella thermotolerans]|uniref:Acyl-CoA thioesterase n=1 Tax=Bailinhaonella thermotolerans TaxID=1070861 RepID=A0A3A4BNU6_9ACTN|nr:thioesterase family protein [Bailinhaonella thermotolerans]RJL32744.1 acyl-CoA thioesterase [Bailinhaonella thermotolerans]
MTAATPPNGDYAHWHDVPTRWNDNDSYGHVNNVIHYAAMDTAINTWLITEAGLDIHRGPAVGMCVESRCTYKAEATFPEVIRVGLRVGRLGRSSVRWELGLHRSSDGVLIAEGDFTHVFCDRVTRRPVPIEGPMRAAMERLVIS